MNLATVTASLIIAAASWYLLKEFAPLLRPLLLAVFLCYIILPVHHKVAYRLPTITSVLFLAGLSIGVLVMVGLVIAGSVSELKDELPELIERARKIFDDLARYSIEHSPPWLADAVREMRSSQTQFQWKGMLEQAAGTVASAMANTLSEAVLVGIYLMFLLVEAGRIPRRIEGAFTGDRPQQILAVVGNINAAMASYLRVKVKASLVLAIPATIVLWSFGVKFALMWGMLTFFLNFIPYLGSIITCGSPILLAYLQMDSLGTPTVVAGILISIHLLSAYVVEPAMTGKAIDLSPLVILLSLAFWGLCWGLTGMLLAVPLTVMLKIVLQNLPLTRPFGRLMAED
jgi:AI-2 transport protein TqsA